MNKITLTQIRSETDILLNIECEGGVKKHNEIL